MPRFYHSPRGEPKSLHLRAEVKVLVGQVSGTGEMRYSICFAALETLHFTTRKPRVLGAPACATQNHLERGGLVSAAGLDLYVDVDQRDGCWRDSRNAAGLA